MSKLRVLTWLARCLVAGAAAGCCCLAVAAGYKFKALPAPPGAVSSYAGWINREGVVLGGWKSSPSADWSALRWSKDGGMEVLNIYGQIVGFNDNGAFALYEGFIVSKDLVMTPLNPGGILPFVYGLNNHGVASGQPWEGVPALMTRTRTTRLLPAKYFNFCEAVNDHDVAVGVAYDPGESGVAVVWRDGIPTLLPQAPWPESEATKINNHNLIVGTVNEGGYLNVRAAYWSQDQLTVLPSPGNAAAYGLNDEGQIVGDSDQNGLYHATLWTREQGVVDLNQYLPASWVAAGWYLQFASSINSSGDIVGNMSNDALGLSQGFILVRETR
jgi:uncharacterized membrane protein